MRSPMWRYRHSVIQRLLDAPQHFHFVQAVRLLEICLLRRGIMRCNVLAHHLRFRNSLSLSFAASDIEALEINGTARRKGIRIPAGEVIGGLRRAFVTPAFLSLLGAQGALPLHYTHSLAARLHDEGNDGMHAFFDWLSHRSVALFYLAWIRGRVEHLADEGGRDGYLPLQLALAGRAHRVASTERAGADGHFAGQGADAGQNPHSHRIALPCIAHYAALMRGRDVSAPIIEQILAAYFGMPMRIEQFAGQWEILAPEERNLLGQSNCKLGAGLTLGRRYRRRDQCAEIIVGPLARVDFDRFLPGAECELALKALVAQFPVATVRFRVRVILRAQDVRPVTLTGRGHPSRYRLGWNTLLTMQPGAMGCEMVYLLKGESDGI